MKRFFVCTVVALLGVSLMAAEANAGRRGFGVRGGRAGFRGGFRGGFGGGGVIVAPGVGVGVPLITNQVFTPGFATNFSAFNAGVAVDAFGNPLILNNGFNGLAFGVGGGRAGFNGRGFVRGGRGVRGVRAGARGRAVRGGRAGFRRR